MIFQGELEPLTRSVLNTTIMIGKLFVWYIIVLILCVVPSRAVMYLITLVCLKVWSLINSPQLDCSSFTATTAVAAQKSGAKNGKQRVTNLKRSSKCF